MQQKSLSNWLKVAIICLAVFGLLVYGMVIPNYGRNLAVQNPDYAHCFWPWMTLLILTTVPAAVCARSDSRAPGPVSDLLLK